MLFRKWGCLVGPENSIFRKLKSVDPKKKAFDHRNAFTLLFSLQSISGKWERERERERVRARERRRSSPGSRAPAPVRDRELQLQSEIAIDGEIAPSIAISRRRRDCDRAVDRDLGSWSRRERRDRDLGSRSRRGRRTANISGIDDFFFSGLWLVFSVLCFPSSFPNTRKYFPENILKCNQTHGNILLFRKTFYSNQTQPKVLTHPHFGQRLKKCKRQNS